MNRKILDALRLTIGGECPDWDLHIPSAQFSINSLNNSAIGMSPHAALYGVQPRSPFDLLKERNVIVHPLDSVFNNAVDRFQNLKRLLEDSNVTQKKYHDKNIKDTSFQVGDKVFVKRNVRRELNYKLGKKFDGPFSVLECLRADRYRVSRVGNDSDVRTVPVSHLKRSR